MKLSAIRDSEFLKYCNAEQYLLIDGVLYNFAPTTIIPVIYQGIIAGSEFLTYDANKLYIALEFVASGDSAGFGAANFGIFLYDSANVFSLAYTKNSVYYNSTTTNALVQPFVIESKNMFFSKIATFGYTHLKFIGYKLTK